MGHWLSEWTGKKFIVQNRPGAATDIATEIVVMRRPTATRSFLLGVSAAINATLYEISATISCATSRPSR